MVHIERAETIELLARMEGEQWRQTQDDRPHDPQGFQFWLRAWNAKLAAGLRDVPAPLTSFAERATRAPMFYGATSFHQYRIAPDGEITLIRDRVLPEAIARARSLGIPLA